MDIRNELERLRDEKYREFSLSLLPNADKSKMIGVRLPQLRAVAARIKKESPRRGMLCGRGQIFLGINQLWLE